MSAPLKLSRQDVRRLAITRQHLDAADRPAMLDVIRDLGCLQLDPISAVERTHLLVMWSRVGHYDTADLNRLIYEERHLFEYWAHAASLVLTEDFPIHQYHMRCEPYSGNSNWDARSREWLASVENHDPPLSQYVRDRLRAEGALLSRQFDDQRVGWDSNGGWSSGRNVNRMLDYLWVKGEVLVSHRQGKQRYWDLAERILPQWMDHPPLPPRDVTRQAAQTAVRALGAATPRQITLHYTRYRYPDLLEVLDELVTAGRLIPAEVEDVKGPWYVHADDLPALTRIQQGEFAPRTTLLSPFDNLICDRDRTKALWDFLYRIEIYVPADKRQYGYYVLPILHGDRLIGRIDPKYDRRRHTLHLNTIYAEDGAPDDDATLTGIAEAIRSLAAFLGARQLEIGAPLPPVWARLRQHLAL